MSAQDLCPCTIQTRYDLFRGEAIKLHTTKMLGADRKCAED